MGISHMFMTSGGTRRERAAVSVTDMGSGVFNGAFTTGLGFAPLAFAKMGICVTFSYVFMLIIMLGLLHGFILLPLMLAKWGPDPVTIHGHGSGHSPSSTPDHTMELEMDNIQTTGNPV